MVTTDESTGGRATGTAASAAPGSLSLRVLPPVVLAVAFVLVAGGAAAPLHNPDTWFHLRLGEEFLHGWSVSDPGTMTRFATADWVPTQWSTQILMAAVEGWLGLPGLAWLFGLLSLLFVAALYLLCRRSSSPVIAALVTLAAVIACSASLSARPQSVSLILLCVVVGAWAQSVRDLRARWWLVPLTWVWATAHGFWSMGVLVGLVCCVGLALERRLDLRTGLSLAAVPLLSLVAACLTPVGPRLLGSQLAVSERAQFISEWGPTSFREWPALVAAGLLALLLALWARRGGVTWVPLLLALLAGGLTIYAVRLVSVGVIIAAPLLAAALDELAPTLRRRLGRVELVAVAAGVALTAAVLADVVPVTADEPSNAPIGLSPQLGQLPAGTVVLVEGPVGAWIEWAHPTLEPTMDGMFDAYPLGYIRDYKSAIELEPGWQDFVADVRARAAVVPRNGALADALVEQEDWQVTGTSGRWALLRPTGD